MKIDTGLRVISLSIFFYVRGQNIRSERLRILGLTLEWRFLREISLLFRKDI